MNKKIKIFLKLKLKELLWMIPLMILGIISSNIIPNPFYLLPAWIVGIIAIVWFCFTIYIVFIWLYSNWKHAEELTKELAKGD